MIVIGLTGAPCSGKGTVMEVLFAMCAERGLAARHVSFSDEIREEALSRGIHGARIDRDLIIKLVAEMRAEEGPAVLAKRVVRRVAQTEADVFVVEAVRHPAEADVLREAFAGAFVLAGIVAEIDDMAHRLLARDRADESRTAKQSLAMARELIRTELTGGEGTTVQVGRCLEIADLTLRNTGTLDDLQQSVRDLFDPLLPARA